MERKFPPAEIPAHAVMTKLKGTTSRQVHSHVEGILNKEGLLKLVTESLLVATEGLLVGTECLLVATEGLLVGTECLLVASTTSVTSSEGLLV
jgi:hypothetical protein